MSTKTLYNYVDLGLMDIKSINLPEKVKRNTKARRVRANKRILGRNIENAVLESITVRTLDTGNATWFLDTRPRMMMYCLLCVNERYVTSS